MLRGIPASAERESFKGAQNTDACNITIEWGSRTHTHTHTHTQAVAASGSFLRQVSQESSVSSSSGDGKKFKQKEKKGKGKKHQSAVDEPVGTGWEIKFMSQDEVV